MAKKKKYNLKRKSTTKITREEDASHRVSFLLSASHLLHATSPSLSRFYNGTVKQIGRRINLSLDAVSVKRLICKRCNTLLVAENSRRRLASRRQSHVVVTCKRCGAKRRYVNRDRRESRATSTEPSSETPETVEDTAVPTSGPGAGALAPEKAEDTAIPTAEPRRKRSRISDMCTMV